MVVIILLTFWGAMSDKRHQGMRLSETRSIKKITRQVSTLIAEGKYQEAQVLLGKFNNEYSASMNYIDAKEFLENLAEDAPNK